MASKKEYVSENPQLMKEWNWEKNVEFDPNKLTVGSGIKVWWKCEKEHEWQAIIQNRSKGSGCPYCAGKKALNGLNDLQTVNPSLAKEWNWEKNGNLLPEHFVAYSHEKVWWKCKNGHIWQATIIARNNGHGCPYCSGRFAIKGENDLQTINPILAEEWNYEKNNGLTPMDVMSNSGKKVWWKCSEGHEWEATIGDRNKGSGCPFCSGKTVLKGYNDLQTVNPTLAEEWDYEKNGNLMPENFTANCSKKVWWKCSKGHEWQAKIYHRNNGSGCPICFSERNTSFPEYALVFYLEKYGVETIHSYKEKRFELDIYIPTKKIAIEYDGYYWHKNKMKQDLDKNSKCQKEGIKLYRIREGLPPLNDSSLDYVVQKTQKDLPLILEKILSEIIGTSIDVDLERDAIAIENLREFTEKDNSILFSNPEIASEWNYEKNGTLRPEYFATNSSKKVWWKCSKEHEWQAIIQNRSKGHGCPFCSGLYAVKGENDLQTVNPTLAKEWNYEKNDGLTPMDVLPNSEKKVWWKCSKGHEWQAMIGNRNKGEGCPCCSGKQVLRGYNDLQTVNPILAKEWNYEKNNGLTPDNITFGSNNKVWWKCVNGHEWQATICGRNKGNGCPYCSCRYAVKGENDLQTTNPSLAKEWNYEKNGHLKPEDFKANSNKKVWWKCSKGHEWQAIICNRNRGNGCPFCAGQKVSKGYNDLQTINPILAQEWNYEKNDELTPMDVMPNSSKKVWWKCGKGHEWQAIIGSRNKGNGCPQCAKEKRKAIK